MGEGSKETLVRRCCMRWAEGFRRHSGEEACLGLHGLRKIFRVLKNGGALHATTPGKLQKRGATVMD